MDWFKVYAGIQHHPKRYAFEEVAQTKYGLQYIVGLFCFTCTYAPEGDLSKFSAGQIAKACEWEGDANLFMQALVSAGFLDKNDQTCIVHDWSEIHQRFIKENEKRKPVKEVTNPRVTQGLPLVEENRIEEKREEKKIPLSAFADEFAKFWAIYPKKKARADAFKAWCKVKPPLEAVLTAIAWQRKTDEWKEDGGKYIKLAGGYLRDRRWEDEPPYQARPVERIIPKTLGDHFKVGF